MAVMRFSWTAMSLRSPKQSCTLSSPERNFSRRFDAFLPGKTAAKIADAADPQHQSFLVQPAVFGIEIDRNFRCALGRCLERAKAGNFRKARHICRRNLEFQLDFLGNWHGASPNGLPRQGSGD